MITVFNVMSWMTLFFLLMVLWFCVTEILRMK